MINWVATMDWSRLFDQATPFFVLCAAALVVMVIDCFARDAATHNERAWHSPAVVVAFAGVLLAAWLIFPRWQTGNADPAPLALWYFDRIAWVTAALLLGTAALSILLAPSYLRARGLPRGEYLALLLFGVAGLWVMVATHHLIMVFIGIETLSIAAYVLAAYHRTDRFSIEAGMKYFVMGSVAAAFLLFGMAFLYGGTGTLDLLEYRSLTLDGMEHARQLYTFIGIGCLLVGFVFKIAAVPFHWWAPDVYGGAPLPVTVFFATAVKAGAFVALWRVAEALMPFTGAVWSQGFWWLAVLTMTLGNLAALTQEDMKRMLAYSSIAHAGYALIALVLLPHGNGMVVASLLMYLVAYTLMTVGAFAVLIALSDAGGERTTLNQVAGLAQRHPALAAMYAVFLLSLAGVPPTIGFFGKYYLFQTAIAEGYTSLVVIAVLNSVVSVAYYVRPIITMYFRPSADEGAVAPATLTAGVRTVLAVTLLGVLWYGLFPSGLLKLLLQSV